MPCYNKTIMSISTLLAQSTYYYNEYGRSGSSDAFDGTGVTSWAILASFFFVGFIFGLAIYAFVSFCLMKIFKKAGVKPWIAWVPFYNNWKLLEIGGQPGFWAVLAIIPVVNIVSAVFLYIAMFHVGKKLGKGGEFVLWAILLPYVWYAWLAFDKSTWNEAGSTAPSLAK